MTKKPWQPYEEVAAQTNIFEVLLNQNSTTTDYMLSFPNQIHIGISETVHITEKTMIQVRDKDGNVVDRQKY